MKFFVINSPKLSAAAALLAYKATQMGPKTSHTGQNDHLPLQSLSMYISNASHVPYKARRGCARAACFDIVCQPAHYSLTIIVAIPANSSINFLSPINKLRYEKKSSEEIQKSFTQFVHSFVMLERGVNVLFKFGTGAVNPSEEATARLVRWLGNWLSRNGQTGLKFVDGRGGRPNSEGVGLLK
uniref:SFRICE_027096 n=1 Tax=Spodoptera frugiperda TaxID=7108 RepID=A0A2H1W4A4_SPOFR